jgi:predicted nucleotide-binding protein
VIEEAHDLFLSMSEVESKTSKPSDLAVVVNGELWSFDTREEFLAAYPKASYFNILHSHYHSGQVHTLHIRAKEECKNTTSIHVKLPTRAQIESIFHVFERALPASRIVVESKPLKIFIGHGHDPQWRELKDHLHEKHGMTVVEYEIGPRAGLSVKEVLERMLHDSSIAFLVLTGEDMHTDGELHARENVIHELGLFQGKLGFKRAIAILEEDVKEFSNILGINQIRLSKGRIRETYGDVLATIKRELECEERLEP